MKANNPYTVGHAQLAKVETPSATRTWNPISHVQLFELFANQLNRKSLKLVDAKHTLSHQGSRYFGVINVTRKKQDADFHLSVGVRNSHDKFLAAGGVAGSRVIVCSNLMFDGEWKFTERHTSQVEARLEDQVAVVVDKLMANYSLQDDRFARYKTFELSDSSAHDLIIQSIDAGVIAARDIPHVIKQWRTPDHPEFSADGKTAWRLFNSFTDFFKEVNLFDLPKRGKALNELMDSAIR